MGNDELKMQNGWLVILHFSFFIAHFPFLNPVAAASI